MRVVGEGFVKNGFGNLNVEGARVDDEGFVKVGVGGERGKTAKAMKKGKKTNSCVGSGGGDKVCSDNAQGGDRSWEMLAVCRKAVVADRRRVASRSPTAPWNSWRRKLVRVCRASLRSSIDRRERR